MAVRRAHGDAMLAVGLLLVVGLYSRPKRRGAQASRPVIEWSDREMQAFIDEVGPIGVPLDAALLVYTSESGLDPKASSGVAWGIAQLTALTLKDLGWNKPGREFGKLTLVQQFPWVAKLLAYQARMIGFVPKNALDLYVANFKPAAFRNNDQILYREGTEAYRKNAPLDRAKKGYIERNDLKTSLDQARFSQTYQRAIAQLERLQRAQASNQ